MSKFGYISKPCFDKNKFFILIDKEGKLNYPTKQHYWEEYVISHQQELESFYHALDLTNDTSQYIKKSVDCYFARKAYGLPINEILARQKS